MTPRELIQAVVNEWSGADPCKLADCPIGMCKPMAALREWLAANPGDGPADGSLDESLKDVRAHIERLEMSLRAYINGHQAALMRAEAAEHARHVASCHATELERGRDESDEKCDEMARKLAEVERERDAIGLASTERYVDELGKNRDLRAQLAESKRERDNWIETAVQMDRGRTFYQGLVRQIGERFGVAARTSDDGSVQDDVLALRVPELVDAALAQVRTLREALDEAVNVRPDDNEGTPYCRICDSPFARCERSGCCVGKRARATLDATEGTK